MGHVKPLVVTTDEVSAELRALELHIYDMLAGFTQRTGLAAQVYIDTQDLTSFGNSRKSYSYEVRVTAEVTP